MKFKSVYDGTVCCVDSYGEREVESATKRDRIPFRPVQLHV